MMEEIGISSRSKKIPCMRNVSVLLGALLVLWVLFSCSALGKGEKGKEEKRPKETEETRREEAAETKEGEGPGKVREDPPEEKRSYVVTKEPERDERVERRQRAIDLIEKKEYLLALNFINHERRRDLDQEYIVAINGLIASGEESFQRENYGEAGLSFRKVLENYPSRKFLRARVERPREWLESRITTFSERLMIQGLSEYREGNLAAAIETWKKILRFNSGYQPAKKAIETTEVQLKNLRSIDGKKR